MGQWVVAIVGGLVAVQAAACQRSLEAAMAARGGVVVSHATVAARPASTESALQAMFAAADVVFAGEVTHIERMDGAVAVQFRVDDAVRGVTGDGYTLREWNGLWADGAPRYAVGQRLLMLLHAPSAAGFASPVGGMDGAIPLSGDGAAGSADLRWVAARAEHTPVVKAMRVAPGDPDGGDAAEATAPAAVGSDAADRGVVMDLLHAWQRQAVLR